MSILDRYIFRSFFTNLFLWFVSFVGIFVVFDLLSNIESYFNVQGDRSVLSVLAEYFFYRTFLFIDIVLPLLILVSALTVASSMLRRNEVIALMAMGVPHRRVIAPLLIAAVALSIGAFGIREFYLPAHLIRLIQTPSELSRQQSQLPVSRSTDSWSKISIDGKTVNPVEKTIQEPLFMLPVLLAPNGNELAAAQAVWHDADETFPDGYRLLGVSRPKGMLTSPSLDVTGRKQGDFQTVLIDEKAGKTGVETADSGINNSGINNNSGANNDAFRGNGSNNINTINKGDFRAAPLQEKFQPVIYSPADTPALGSDECFIATGITPEYLAVGDMWKLYASTSGLVEAMKNRSTPMHRNDLQTRIHSRILRPLADLLPILIGLPFLFLKNDRSIFKGMAAAMVFAGIYMGVSYASLYFGKELNAPILGAWMPLIVFTPVVANIFADIWKN